MSERSPGIARQLLVPLNFIDDWIAKFESVVLAFGILGIAAVTIANVLGRFLVGQSIYFAEELTQFLVVLVTFVGIGYAARQGRHIRMSAIYDSLPDRGRKALMIVICIVTAIMMFVLAWYAALYVISVAQTGRITPALQWPIYVTFLWVPIGLAITGIQYLLTALKNATHPDIFISSTVVDSYEEADTQI